MSCFMHAEWIDEQMLAKDQLTCSVNLKKNLFCSPGNVQCAEVAVAQHMRLFVGEKPGGKTLDPRMEMFKVDSARGSF